MKALSLLFLFFFFFAFAVLAQEETASDIFIYDLELEKLLNFGSGLLAAVLFVLTFTAYRRTHNQRLLYVSIAFDLFAFKGFLIAHELFFDEWLFVDPVASVLDFAILLFFFFGIIKK